MEHVYSEIHPHADGAISIIYYQTEEGEPTPKCCATHGKGVTLDRYGNVENIEMLFIEEK